MIILQVAGLVVCAPLAFVALAAAGAGLRRLARGSGNPGMTALVTTIFLLAAVLLTGVCAWIVKGMIL